MVQAESLSHLESIFTREDIKQVVRKIKNAHKQGKRIHLPRDKVESVQQAYKREMQEADARTLVLVGTFLGEYWDPTKVKTSMTLEGLCTYTFHKDPIIVTEDLTREHITVLMTTDEDLTNMIATKHKEIQRCSAHNVPVEIEKSFSVYTPYDFAMEVLTLPNLSFSGSYEQVRKERGVKVIGITSRIKSPGNLADKITDRILGIDRVYRTDKIPSVDDEIKDLSGTRFVTVNEDLCYVVLDYLRKRRDISIADEKDYIKNPKENGYRALNLIVHYLSLPHEIQIVDTEMFDWNKLNPDASHKTYRQVIREAREQIGRSWFDLNGQLRQLFGLKPDPVAERYYHKD